MSNRFAATYHINKYTEGEDGDFAYELLDLNVVMESFYEEDFVVGEHTDTYYDVTHGLLKEYPEGCYRVFIIGAILYSVDYYGEHDIDVEVDYSSVSPLPKELAEWN